MVMNSLARRKPLSTKKTETCRFIDNQGKKPVEGKPPHSALLTFFRGALRPARPGESPDRADPIHPGGLAAGPVEMVIGRPAGSEDGPARSRPSHTRGPAGRIIAVSHAPLSMDFTGRTTIDCARRARSTEIQIPWRAVGRPEMTGRSSIGPSRPDGVARNWDGGTRSRAMHRVRPSDRREVARWPSGPSAAGDDAGQ